MSVRGSLRASPPSIHHLLDNQSYPPMPCKLEASATTAFPEAPGGAHPSLPTGRPR